MLRKMGRHKATQGDASIREGASYIRNFNSGRTRFNEVVKRLNECCGKYGDYEKCPDLNVCLEEFDNRCDIRDAECPSCKKIVPRRKYCEMCGEELNSF